MIKVGNRSGKYIKKEDEEDKVFRLSNKMQLSTIISVAKDVYERSEDYIIKRYELGTNLEWGNYVLSFRDESYRASNLSINQLCRLYDIPKKTVNSLLEKSVKMAIKENECYEPMKELANDLFNKQLISENELSTDRKMMLRIMNSFQGNEKYVRAILSDKFSPMDNYPLLDVCKNVLSKYYVVNAAFIDDEAMVARFYFKEGLVVNERKFAIGVEMRNSEVGTYSLQIRVIVSSSEFGSFILTSTPIIRLKHSGSANNMLNIAIELEELATTLRETINEKVRLLFLDDNLNSKTLDTFLSSIKDIVKKEEFNEINKISISNGKLHFLKGLYSIVYESDYVKMDKIENEVTKQIFGQLII